MMTFGIGRGVEYYDMPVIRSIVRDAEKSNYRFSAILMGIIKSAPVSDENESCRERRKLKRSQ